MGVTFTGDWDGVKHLRERLSQNERSIREKTSEYAADLYLAELKKIIALNGDGAQWKITTKWAHKKLKFDSDHIYVATGKFVSKLRKVKLADGAYFAGAYAQDQYDENLTMEQLAFYQEFGTRDMQAKPLFKPAAQKIYDPIHKKLLENIKDVVEKRNH